MKMKFMREVFQVKNNQLLQYSMELSMLSQLLKNHTITEKEYLKIKNILMKEYHILSDLTAMVA